MPAMGMLLGLIVRGHGPLLQSPFPKVIGDKTQRHSPDKVIPFFIFDLHGLQDFTMTTKRKLITFDWAIKRLLRSKANYLKKTAWNPSTRNIT